MYVCYIHRLHINNIIMRNNVERQQKNSFLSGLFAYQEGINEKISSLCVGIVNDTQT